MPITTKTNDGVTDKVYSILAKKDGKVTYIGPNHSDLAIETLRLESSAPNPRGNDYGNRRSAIVLNHDVSVPTKDGGTTSKTMSFRFEVSVPVGASDVSVLEAKQNLAHLLQDDAFSDALIVTGKVEH